MVEKAQCKLGQRINFFFKLKIPMEHKFSIAQPLEGNQNGKEKNKFFPLDDDLTLPLFFFLLFQDSIPNPPGKFPLKGGKTLKLVVNI